MKGKKILSLFLSFVMVISVVAGLDITTAFAETSEDGDWTYTISDDGTAVITAYNGSDTVITIPATVDGYTVTEVGNFAFDSCTSLTSIVIPDSVTTLGNGAFSGCTALESVTIGSGLTTIGDYTFYRCESLTSILIPDSVTTIDYGAFGCCYALESVTIGSGLTTIGDYAFYHCESLTSIVIPDSVTTIDEGAFSYCYALESVTIGSGVASIGGCAFLEAAITSITIPDNVTTLGNGAFSGCTALESVTIGSGLTSLDDSTFSTCTSLVSIEIPDNITSIGGYVFYGCTALESIVIPSTVTSLGEKLFYNCSSLETIVVLSSSVKFVQNMLHGTDNLKTFISISTSSNGENIFYYSSDDVVVYALYESSFSSYKVRRDRTFVAIDYTTTEEDCGNDGIIAITVSEETDADVLEELGLSVGDVVWEGTYTSATGEHSYGLTATTDATCIDVGTATYTCSVCGDTYTEETDAALGHDYVATVTDPTCVDEGYTTYVCSRCDDTYVDDYVDATGHSYSWTLVSKKPTKMCSFDDDVLVTIPFTDLTDTSYSSYYDRIAYLSCYNSFINGTSSTTYSPTKALTRAAALTILYRMAGSPYDDANPYTSSPFTDVKTTAYYYNAACWALDNGITTNTTFKGSSSATRQETVTFLYRYVSYCTDVEITTKSISSFSDASSVSSWAKTAMQWAYANGLITGNSSGKLNPTGVTYRIYASKIYYQFGLTCGIGNFE